MTPTLHDNNVAIAQCTAYKATLMTTMSLLHSWQHGAKRLMIDCCHDMFRMLVLGLALLCCLGLYNMVLHTRTAISYITHLIVQCGEA